MLKIFSKFLLLSFSILLIAGLITPFFLDKEKIVSSINKKIKNDFNFDLEFDKNVHLSFLPVPKLVVNDLVFIDDTNSLKINVSQVSITSTWKSLIKLKPDFKSIDFDTPEIDLQKKKYSKKNIIFVKNNNNFDSARNFLNKINKIRIKNGKINFSKFNSHNKIENFNLTLINSDLYKLKAEFDYPDLNSFFKLSAVSENFQNIDFNLNQLLNKKNEIYGSGNLILEKEQFKLKGKFESEKIRLDEILDTISYLKFKKDDVYLVSVAKSQLDLDLGFEFKKLIFGESNFTNVSSKILSKGQDFIIKDFKANYEETLIKSDAIYKNKKSILKGKLYIFDFLVNKELSKKMKLSLNDANFDCDMDFVFNTQTKSIKLLDKLHVTGDCSAPKAMLVGISVDKTIDKIDNIQTFQDFFNLFKKNEMGGTTKIDSISFTFSLKNGILKIKDSLASQKNLKIKSIGNFSVYENKVNFKNQIFVKTKKFENLPSFNVMIAGPKNDYKVSYDFAELKSSVLSNGINSLLKKQKKIVIDPNSIKKLIDKESKKIRPDKIIEMLFD